MKVLGFASDYSTVVSQCTVVEYFQLLQYCRCTVSVVGSDVRLEASSALQFYYWFYFLTLATLLSCLLSVSNWGSETDESQTYHNGNSDPRGFGEINVVQIFMFPVPNKEI